MSCESECALRFRAAVPADAQRLVDIDRAGAGTGLPRLDDLCSGGSPTTGLLAVAEQGGQLCGFALYTVVVDEGSLNNIAVDPQCQGRGLGRQLLQHILGEMRAAGALRCLLELRASNAAALALYRSEGFSLDGKRPDYYPTATGVREDALLMSKQL